MKHRILRILLSCALLTLGVTTASAAAGAPASAASCYTWGRTLSQGTSGSDVAQLQIRVAG